MNQHIEWFKRFAACYLMWSHSNMDRIVSETVKKQAALKSSPSSSSREVREATIELVAEAIRLRAVERGYPVHPNVASHLAVAAILALKSSPSAVAVQSVGEWRPIETAPKDGSQIIAICNDHSKLYRMSWGRARDGKMWWCTTTNSYGEGLFNCGGGWIPCPPAVSSTNITSEGGE